MKKFIGNRTATAVTVFVVDGPDHRLLELEPSFKLARHSPTGFEWGYSGSGPAQLALAMMLEYYLAAGASIEDAGHTALAHHQEFKRQIVANMPDTRWELTFDDIALWGVAPGGTIARLKAQWGATRNEQIAADRRN